MCYAVVVVALVVVVVVVDVAASGGRPVLVFSVTVSLTHAVVFVMGIIIRERYRWIICRYTSNQSGGKEDPRASRQGS